jgi:hypothetical protein
MSGVTHGKANTQHHFTTPSLYFSHVNRVAAHIVGDDNARPMITRSDASAFSALVYARVKRIVARCHCLWSYHLSHTEMLQLIFRVGSEINASANTDREFGVMTHMLLDKLYGTHWRKGQDFDFDSYLYVEMFDPLPCGTNTAPRGELCDWVGGRYHNEFCRALPQLLGNVVKMGGMERSPFNADVNKLVNAQNDISLDNVLNVWVTGYDSELQTSMFSHADEGSSCIADSEDVETYHEDWTYMSNRGASKFNVRTIAAFPTLPSALTLYAEKEVFTRNVCYRSRIRTEDISPRVDPSGSEMYLFTGETIIYVPISKATYNKARERMSTRLEAFLRDNDGLDASMCTYANNDVHDDNVCTYIRAPSLPRDVIDLSTSAGVAEYSRKYDTMCDALRYSFIVPRHVFNVFPVLSLWLAIPQRSHTVASVIRQMIVYAITVLGFDDEFRSARGRYSWMGISSSETRYFKAYTIRWRSRCTVGTAAMLENSQFEGGLMPVRAEEGSSRKKSRPKGPLVDQVFTVHRTAVHSCLPRKLDEVWHTTIALVDLVNQMADGRDAISEALRAREQKVRSKYSWLCKVDNDGNHVEVGITTKEGFINDPSNDIVLRGVNPDSRFWRDYALCRMPGLYESEGTWKDAALREVTDITPFMKYVGEAVNIRFFPEEEKWWNPRRVSAMDTMLDNFWGLPYFAREMFMYGDFLTRLTVDLDSDESRSCDCVDFSPPVMRSRCLATLTHELHMHIVTHSPHAVLVKSGDVFDYLGSVGMSSFIVSKITTFITYETVHELRSKQTPAGARAALLSTFGELRMREFEADSSLCHTLVMLATFWAIRVNLPISFMRKMFVMELSLKNISEALRKVINV